ncbi:MAG: site-specific integrase [Bacteroidales bacterium]|nr:site-specific integrase [Bacteroidales bacterium]
MSKSKYQGRSNSQTRLREGSYSSDKALINVSSLDLSGLAKARYQNNRMLLSKAAQSNLLSIGRKFNAYLQKRQSTITSDAINEFLEELKYEYAPSTWNLARQNLKRLLKLQSQVSSNYLLRLVIDEIFKDIRPIKLDRQVKEYLSENEIHQLIRQSPTKLGLIIETLFLTGCRISEMTGIRWRDIRVDHAQAGLQILGKGRMIRTVYVPTSLIDRIKREFNSRVYLFENRNHHRLDSSNLWKKIKQAGREILKRDNIHPHLLRHSTANFLIKKGRSIKYISKYMGHSSPAVTLDMYVHEQPGAEIISLFDQIA